MLIAAQLAGVFYLLWRLSQQGFRFLHQLRHLFGS